MSKYLKQGTLPYLQKLAKVLGKDLVFVDLETTGFVNASNFAIIEVGIAIISGDKGILEESSLLNPNCPIPYRITEITGITNKMVQGKPTFKDRYLNFFEKTSKDHILIGYNSRSFDSKGIEKVGQQNGKNFIFRNQLDVMKIFKREKLETTGIKKGHKLSDAKEHYNIKIEGDAHRAGYDIALTAVVLEVILQKHGIQYILNEIEELECAKTKAKFRNEFSEDFKYSSVKNNKKKTSNKSDNTEFKAVFKDDKKPLKPSVTNKNAKNVVSKSTVAKKTTQTSKSKKKNENDEYRKKYLAEKRENSGFLGKIIGSIFD